MEENEVFHEEFKNARDYVCWKLRHGDGVIFLPFAFPHSETRVNCSESKSQILRAEGLGASVTVTAMECRPYLCLDLSPFPILLVRHTTTEYNITKSGNRTVRSEFRCSVETMAIPPVTVTYGSSSCQSGVVIVAIFFLHHVHSLQTPCLARKTVVRAH